MPTESQHIAKAQENEAFALSLNLKDRRAVEWAITILFYVAVHYVQAYFVNKGKVYTQHTHRDSAIQRDPNLKKIYGDYRELETHSRDARYDVPGFAEVDFHRIMPCLKNIKACVTTFV